MEKIITLSDGRTLKITQIMARYSIIETDGTVKQTPAVLFFDQAIADGMTLPETIISEKVLGTEE